MRTHTHAHTRTESSSVPADQVDVEPEEDGGRETKHGRQKIAEDDLELVRRTVMEHITLQCVCVCVCECGCVYIIVREGVSEGGSE